VYRQSASRMIWRICSRSADMALSRGV